MKASAAQWLRKPLCLRAKEGASERSHPIASVAAESDGASIAAEVPELGHGSNVTEVGKTATN